MVEQKKLKLEDAVMLDKNRIIHEVAKNKNFNIVCFIFWIKRLKYSKFIKMKKSKNNNRSFESCLKQLEEIVGEARKTHEILDGLLLHRIGNVYPGEDIVLVAVWSTHRKDAFAACREIMEALKSKAPFWKKETLVEGDRWVENNTPGV